MAVMAALPARAATPVAPAPSPLVYFFMDTDRPVTEKASDLAVIEQMVTRLRASHPNTRYVFHLTNLRLQVDDVCNLFYDGTPERESVRTSLLEAYALPALPPEYREQRRLDQELRLVSANLRKLRAPDGGASCRLGAQAEGPRWLIAFHAFDWVDPTHRLNSSGRFLGDGWLISAKSPLRTGFLSQDNAEWKGMKVLAFVDRLDELTVRRGKEQFASRLLRMVGADLLYLGPLHAIAGGPAPIAAGYIEAMQAGQLKPITAGTPSRAELLQIIGGDRATETVDVYH